MGPSGPYVQPTHFVNNEYTMRKFITDHDDIPEEYELYNVVNDPLELRNAADDHPEVVKELKAVLDEQEKEISKKAVKGSFNPEFRQYF